MHGLPTSRALVYESSFYCREEIYDSLVAGHALQLGHWCGQEGRQGKYHHEDYDYECFWGNDYMHLDDQTDVEGDRFTCLELLNISDAMMFPSRLPMVEVQANFRYESPPDPSCYVFEGAVTAEDGVTNSNTTITNSTGSP